MSRPLILRGDEPAQAEHSCHEVLTMVGLGHRLEHLPMQLSGGQQQRVAIARALVNSPTVILADEPTGNLDSKTGQEIIDLLRKLQREQNVTIITATHDTRMVDISDRVATIRDGRLESVTLRKDLNVTLGGGDH